MCVCVFSWRWPWSNFSSLFSAGLGTQQKPGGLFGQSPMLGGTSTGNSLLGGGLFNQANAGATGGGLFSKPSTSGTGLIGGGLQLGQQTTGGLGQGGLFGMCVCCDLLSRCNVQCSQ